MLSGQKYMHKSMEYFMTRSWLGDGLLLSMGKLVKIRLIVPLLNPTYSRKEMARQKTSHHTCLSFQDPGAVCRSVRSQFEDPCGYHWKEPGNGSCRRLPSYHSNCLGYHLW